MFQRRSLPEARALLARLAQPDAPYRPIALRHLAHTHFFLGHPDTSAALAQTLLTEAHQQHDTLRIAQAHHILGLVGFYRAAYEAALTHQQTSLRLAQRIGDRQTEADALRQLGVLAWYRGHLDSARTATIESGAQVAQMITALGMILAPEPASTAAGVALAGKVVADFTLGQVLDALGLCWGADCGLQASLAAAQSNLADARSKARAYKAGLTDIGQQLADCLLNAASENAPLLAKIAAYNEARAAYEACVASQVCEWRSQPCR